MPTICLTQADKIVRPTCTSEREKRETAYSVPSISFLSLHSALNEWFWCFCSMVLTLGIYSIVELKVPITSMGPHHKDHSSSSRLDYWNGQWERLLSEWTALLGGCMDGIAIYSLAQSRKWSRWGKRCYNRTRQPHQCQRPGAPRCHRWNNRGWCCREIPPSCEWP